MARDIWVDFNQIDEDRTTTTLLRFARRASDVDVGATLVAGDDDGNQCQAKVVEIFPDGVVKLSLDMGTFRTVECEDLATAS